MALSQSPEWLITAREIEDQLLPLPVLKPGNAWVAFIYVTDHSAQDLSNVLIYLKQKTNIASWIGSLGVGICAGRIEVFGRAGVAVMVGQFPENAFNILPTLKSDVDEIPQNKRQWMTDAMPPFGIVHGDPLNPNIIRLIEALSKDIENAPWKCQGFWLGV